MTASAMPTIALSASEGPVAGKTSRRQSPERKRDGYSVNAGRETPTPRGRLKDHDQGKKMVRRNSLLLPLALCSFCLLFSSCRAAPKGGQEVSECERRHVKHEGGQEANTVGQQCLNMFSRSYFPGRSGQILYVPQKGHFFLQSWKKYNHNSPWDYDTHVPLFFYGPVYIRKGVFSQSVSPADIVPTQCAMLKTPGPPTAAGRSLREILKGNPERPKVILTMIIDQAAYWLIEEHFDELKNFRALKPKGAWFSNCKIDYLPSATAVSHAVIGTGAYPGVNGIVANKMYSSEMGKMEITWRVDAAISPANLACLTLADYWDLQTDNKAIIIAQCSLPRAAGGLIGHGAYLANGDRDILVTYDKQTGNLATNPDYYSLPSYLEGFNSRSYWEEVGGTFLGHKIDDCNEVKFSPVLPRFMGDVFLKMLEEEPVGTDGTTDLLFINQKAMDYVGHKYGAESAEAKDTLIAIDTFIGRVIPLLEQKVGPDNFVFILAGDHGMAPSPEKTGGKRVYEEDLLKQLQAKFDLNGDGRKAFRGSSGYNLYVDIEELERNGFTLEDARRHLMKHESILTAFTESEVIENIANGEGE